ncbi:glycoside hydrolase family 104 protein [Polaromonas sp.]|uniref:glycoside hydrolase family 24 protein n=1 Tax=Polaromonas sp. TaxID=1869339 RepID=UPI002730EE00|nr:glycoside hydrolase family 104 protein [Polaromonas sp.]MDP1740082.1 glycoside hydrolase family 104 protein [Polaromonas sp.]
MSKKAAIVALVALAAVGLFLFAPRAFAAAIATPEPAPPEPAPPEPVYDSGAAGWIDTFDNWAQQLYAETEINAMPLTMPINLQANIAAMQSAIASAEGTAEQPDPYRVCYGYKHLIQSFADHPKATKEWGGETLSDTMCAAAGFGPGCVSTAAGKYQITFTTWTRIKKKLGLPDFSPASQDAAAAELLKERGATSKLAIGDFAGAVAAARKEWASLPGAGYAQPEKSLAWLTARFTEAGGVLA